MHECLYLPLVLVHHSPTDYGGGSEGLTFNGVARGPSLPNVDSISGVGDRLRSMTGTRVEPHKTESFDDFMRRRRQALGPTREELAKRIGEHDRLSDISGLERNLAGLPNRAHLEQIDAALEVSVGELLMNAGAMAEGDGAMGLFAHNAPNLLRGEIVPGVEEPDPSTLIADLTILQATASGMTIVLAHVDRNVTQLRRPSSVSRASRE